MPATIARDHFVLRIIRPLSEPAVNSETPLVWWRTRRPDQLSRKGSASLRMALAGTRMASEPRWLDAATGGGEGSAAIAIGICVRSIRQHPIDANEVDLAVSAALAHALLGDAASAIVLSWALRHRAKLEPRCELISDLWLLADF